MAPEFELKGVQDLLQVFSDRIAITPKGVLGFLNKGMKGTKEIPYRSIHAVQYRKAGPLVSGYLQFTIAGGLESRSGILGATKDENTFLFTSKANLEAQAVKEHVDAKIAAIHAPKPPPIPSQSSSMAAEIKELFDLKEAGAITEEDFAKAKARILG